MPSMLIIVGMTLLLMGTILLGRDAADKGRSGIVFLLPMTSFKYTRDNWDDVWWMALIRIIGFGLFVTGVAISIAKDPAILKEPGRLYNKSAAPVIVGSKRSDVNTFANSQDAILMAIRYDSNPRLSGKAVGREFAYDRVQLADGIVSIQMGEGLLPDMEVRILLDLRLSELSARQSWLVQPGQEDAPEIHISWFEENQSLPETLVINGGYRMELQIAPIDKNEYKGFLQLLLPDEQTSFLSGEFIGFSNHLRYIGDQVNLKYDHPDTLKYVVEQYLRTQYTEGAISELVFQDTKMKLGSGFGVSSVYVTLKSGQVELRHLDLERSAVGWSVVPGSMKTTVVQGPTVGGMNGLAEKTEPAEIIEEPVKPLEPLLVADADWIQFYGQQVKIQLSDGRDQEGVIREFKKGRLRVERYLDTGAVQSWIELDQVTSMYLASGQQLIIQQTQVESAAEASTPLAESPQAAVDAIVAKPTETDSTSAESATPQASSAASKSSVTDAGAVEGSQAQQDLASYVNKIVVIVDNKGKQRQGLVQAFDGKRLTLKVELGSGSLNYYYTPEDIVSIKSM